MSSWNKQRACLICVDIGTPFLMAGYGEMKPAPQTIIQTLVGDRLITPGSQTTPWRLISGILGVMCLVLMATLRMLLKNSYTKLSILLTPSPGPTLEPQEGSSCQKMWIGCQCNCYFISNERKTWEESKNFCASQNSRLLQLQNKDELDFMKHISKYFYWIGLSYNKERCACLWEDGSTLSQDLFPFPQTLNIQMCITYSPKEGFWEEPCRNEMRSICKQQFL